MPVPTCFFADNGGELPGNPRGAFGRLLGFYPHCFALRFGPVWPAVVNHNISLFFMSSRNRQRVATL
jgi:hypothetical protein